jgi:thiol-disulfide isomerase/thioredoxin
VLLWVAIAGFIIVSLFMAKQEAEEQRLLPVGQPAPEFVFQRYGGGVVALRDLRGKVVMLDFWATWCPPCVAEMPSLVQLAREYESKGLVFVAANRDESAVAKTAVQQFIGRRVKDLAPYVVYADDRTSFTYRVSTLPTLYFIGRDGKIQSTHVGAAPELAIRRWIEEALAAK